jgi:magnesium/cobalt transport protein CorA
MKKQLKHITTSKIEDVTLPNDFSTLEKNEFYWLDIKSDNRSEVLDYLNSMNVEQKLLESIKDPNISSRMHILSNSMVSNLPISNSQSFHETDYLTVILAENILITILDEQNTVFQNLEEEIENNPFNFDLNVYWVLYFMKSEILQTGMENAIQMREEVNQLSIRMHEDVGQSLLSDIIRGKREVSQFSNILENQFHVLSFFPKWELGSKEDGGRLLNELKNLFRGFEHLQKNLDRQEDKLESLHAQYQLILQERGNKRLNVLTVVQAIFVPLTLLAGVYGMNFSVMPELNWVNGYYIILGLMGSLVALELWWFKKQGWFD